MPAARISFLSFVIRFVPGRGTQIAVINLGLFSCHKSPVLSLCQMYETIRFDVFIDDISL